MSKVSRSTFALLLLPAIFHAPDALAYFDPASGSLILQMVLGGIAGVAVIVKLYWHKLLDLLGVETSSNDEDNESGEADESDESTEATKDEV